MQPGVVAATESLVDVGLSVPQFRIFRASTDRRFRVVVAGRRFGKTVLALTVLIVEALGGGGPADLWYVAPTYRQAKLIAWRMLKTMVPRGAVRSINETELFVELVNGRRISLKGADKGDSLRGVALHGVVLDEFASMNPEVWTHVLRPALSDNKGWAMFIGSPAGYNHFYDLYQRGADTDQPDWFAWQFTTADGGFVDDDEIAAARDELDERVFRQEYEASWETVAGRVFHAFDRHVNVDSAVVDMGGTLEIGMDFNVDPMCAVVGNRVGTDFHVFDEIVLPNSNTFEMGELIAERFGRRPLTEAEKDRIRRFGAIEGTTAVVDMAREIVISPDSSGGMSGARATSAQIGVTDIGILRAYGLKVEPMSSNPPVRDRLNHTNGMLRTASGISRTLIHPRCKQLIKALDGHTYKRDANGQSTNAPDKTSGLDHITDALGYVLFNRFNVTGAGGGTVRLVAR